MHSLLLGNGVNRAALQKDWTQILRELAAQFEADELIHHLGSKPLSMFIEELCARSRAAAPALSTGSQRVGGLPNRLSRSAKVRTCVEFFASHLAFMERSKAG